MIDNLLKNEEFLSLQAYFKANYKNFFFEKRMGRYINDSDNLPILKDLLYSNLDVARKTFGNDKIIPTSAFFAHYEGDSKLDKHKDAFSGTHTIDIPIYQTEPWDLYIEDVPYCLKENQAIFFLGEELFHWRNPLKNSNAHFAAIFCHYAEPSHWRHKK